MGDSGDISIAYVRAMASITDEVCLLSEPQTSCVTSTNFFPKGPTAGSIAQFAYPTSALLAFLALRSICLYNSHGSLPRLEDTVVRRSVLLGLVALVIGTYVGAPQCCTSTRNANVTRPQARSTSSFAPSLEQEQALIRIKRYVATVPLHQALKS